MLKVINVIIHDPYESLMFKTILIISYYCCLRAGEAVISNSSSNTININQIHFHTTNNINSLTIDFKSYKHSKNNSTKITVNEIQNSTYCPVKFLKQYLTIRPNITGPLFIHHNQKHVNRRTYSRIIKDTVHHLGLDIHKYNTHSLRIGRATDLAIAGVPSELIKQTGRWTSNAYLKYIKFDNFVIPTN